MTHDVDDLRIAAIKPLIPPAILLEEIPLSENGKKTVFAGRQAIDDCLHGRDDRLVVVVDLPITYQTAHEYADRCWPWSKYEQELVLSCASTSKTADDGWLEKPAERSKPRWQLPHQ